MKPVGGATFCPLEKPPIGKKKDLVEKDPNKPSTFSMFVVVKKLI